MDGGGGDSEEKKKGADRPDKGGGGGGEGSDLGVDISPTRGESIKLSPYQLKKPEI